MIKLGSAFLISQATVDRTDDQRY